mmetsp:Transcript_8572/g.35320  ORF Transcript_8572/g.35320 Transcript_8572/m.35320 type:complete len:440 (-) Transcript_8572:952-2271(-)
MATRARPSFSSGRLVGRLVARGSTTTAAADDGERDVEREGRAAADGRGAGDDAAVLLDDLARDREAEARALALLELVRVDLAEDLEEARLVGRGDADAVVAHGDAQRHDDGAVGVDRREPRPRRRRGGADDRRAHLDGGAVDALGVIGGLGELERVGDEVRDAGPEAARVAVDQNRRRGGVDARRQRDAPLVRRRRVRRDGEPDEVDDRERRAPQLEAALLDRRVREHVVERLAHDGERLVDDGEHLADLGRGRALVVAFDVVVVVPGVAVVGVVGDRRWSVVEARARRRRPAQPRRGVDDLAHAELDRVERDADLVEHEAQEAAPLRGGGVLHVEQAVERALARDLARVGLAERGDVEGLGEDVGRGEQEALDEVRDEAEDAEEVDDDEDRPEHGAHGDHERGARRALAVLVDRDELLEPPRAQPRVRLGVAPRRRRR